MKFAQIMLKNSSKLNIPKQVDRFSKFSPSPLSMKQFIDFGKLFNCYLFETDLMGPAHCGGVRKPSERTNKKYHAILTVGHNVTVVNKHGKSFSTMHGLKV